MCFFIGHALLSIICLPACLPACLACLSVCLSISFLFFSCGFLNDRLPVARVFALFFSLFDCSFSNLLAIQHTFHVCLYPPDAAHCLSLFFTFWVRLFPRWNRGIWWYWNIKRWNNDQVLAHHKFGFFFLTFSAVYIYSRTAGVTCCEMRCGWSVQYKQGAQVRSENGILIPCRCSHFLIFGRLRCPACVCVTVERRQQTGAGGEGFVFVEGMIVFIMLSSRSTWMHGNQLFLFIRGAVLYKM